MDSHPRASTCTQAHAQIKEHLNEVNLKKREYQHTHTRSHTHARSKVEEYLNSVILKMRNELRSILKDSVNDYPTKARDKWLFDWPSQIILVVNQIFWCQEVEQVCG